MSFKKLATMALLSLTSADSQAEPDPIFGLEFGFCPIGDDLATHDTISYFDKVRF